MSKFITLLDAAFELAGPEAPDAEVNRWLDILEESADALLVSRAVNGGSPGLPGGISYIADREEWQIPRARLDKWLADQGLIANASVDAPVEVLPRQPAAAHRGTWLDAVEPYVAAKWQTGQFKTIKELYRALEQETGSSDSPFEKGSGAQRNKLVLKESRTAVDLKTFQNQAGRIRRIGGPNSRGN